MKEHIFYPMVNKTVKSLMKLADGNVDRNNIYLILLRYPNDFVRTINGENTKPLYQALLLELDRQYARWNKGGQDAK